MGKEMPNLKDYLTTVTILESISDGIFILNKKGEVKYANKSALKLLDLDFNKLAGKCIDQFLMDETYTSADVIESPDKKCHGIIERFNEGTFENIEAALVNRDKIVPVLLNFSTIEAKNKIEYIILTVKDITQWKNLERELKKQRAISISRDRLRMLGELSVGLIHELTQPLGALKMRLEMINASVDEDRIDVKQLRQNMAGLSELIERMENCIQNIRLYAHQTEDNTIAMVDISKAAESAQKLMVYELNEKDIALTIHKLKKVPYVLSNRLLIEQVFMNLIKNAIDAFSEEEPTKKRKRKIDIEIKPEKRKWVEVFISDNAGGIDKQVIDKIFDPFFTTREVEKYSGIGLTVAKNVITSLGGDIKVKTKKNVGTTFIIRIPLINEDEKAQLLNLIQMLNQA